MPILDQNGRPFPPSNGVEPNQTGRMARMRDHAGSLFDPPDDMALPHVWTFNAVLGSAYRTYWHDRWDEAMRHAREDAIVMRNDVHLMRLLQERKLSFVSLPWHLQVPDPKDPYQARVRNDLERRLRHWRGFTKFRYTLAESLWYGRFANQVKWKWVSASDTPTGRALMVQKWIPTNGDKIGHAYDGTPYILVYSPAAQGLSNAELTITTRGWALMLRGDWRERFVIGTHEVDDMDFFDAEQAEAVHGKGIRSVLFWVDWLKREGLANFLTFFQRVGLGVTIWYFEAGNPESEAQAAQAAKEQSGRVNILWPRSSAGRGAGSGVERLEVPTGGASALIEVNKWFGELEELYVIGQTMSGGADNDSGLGGSGRASFARDTKTAIRNFDAENQADYLTGDEDSPGLVYTMQKWTWPGTVEHFPVWFEYQLKSDESKDALDAASKAWEMGATIKEEEVLEAAGLSTPTADDKVLSKQQQEQQQQAVQTQSQQQSQAADRQHQLQLETLRGQQRQQEQAAAQAQQAASAQAASAQPVIQHYHLGSRARPRRAEAACYAAELQEGEHPRDTLGRFARAAGAEAKSHAQEARKLRSKKERSEHLKPRYKETLHRLRDQVRGHLQTLLPRAVERLQHTTGLPAELFAPLTRGARKAAQEVTRRWQEDLADIRRDVTAGQALGGPPTSQDVEDTFKGKLQPPRLDRDAIADAFESEIGEVVDAYVDRQLDQLPDDIGEDDPRLERAYANGDELEKAIRTVLGTVVNPHVLPGRMRRHGRPRRYAWIYHGPEAPGPNWEEIGEGPRGGKRWQHVSEKKPGLIRRALDWLRGTTEQIEPFPERPRADVQQLKTAPVVARTSGRGGINTGEEVTLQGGGKAMWKPAVGEHTGWTGHGQRHGAIPPRRQYVREHASSRVADLLGLGDLVPPTTVRQLDGGEGSIQEWIDGASLATGAGKQGRYDGPRDHARAAAFDYLAGNSDRHAGNWLVIRQGPQRGKLVLIDNGMSFPLFHGYRDGNHELFDAAGKRRLTVPVEFKNVMDRWPQMEQTLRECGIEEQAIALAKARAQLLQHVARRDGYFSDLRDIYTHGRAWDPAQDPAPET